MAELVAKKGKKTGAPEAPRFGRIKANLKVNLFMIFGICLHHLFVRWVF
jgi:hypothetical protein